MHTPRIPTTKHRALRSAHFSPFHRAFEGRAAIASNCPPQCSLQPSWAPPALEVHPLYSQPLCGPSIGRLGRKDFVPFTPRITPSLLLQRQAEGEEQFPWRTAVQVPKLVLSGWGV